MTGDEFEAAVGIARTIQAAIDKGRKYRRDSQAANTAGWKVAIALGYPDDQQTLSLPGLVELVEALIADRDLWQRRYRTIANDVGISADLPSGGGFVAQTCTRPLHTASPCNGFPRPDCPGYEHWRNMVDL